MNKNTPNMAIDDSKASRISPECPQQVRDILNHAWEHDVGGIKQLISSRSLASAQDPTTGETPLHAAIRACGPADGAHDTQKDGQDSHDNVDQDMNARAVVEELFMSGAIWNDVDGNKETPGCVARRLGRKPLYDLCVDAGVRAELLFALLDGYQQLSSGSDADDDDANDDDANDNDNDANGNDAASPAQQEGHQPQHDQNDSPRTFVPPGAQEKPVTSDEYLQSALTFDSDKLLDSDLNGVMMAWETDIMRRSVAALVPASQPGKRILNIGFGMGIIDSLFAELKPSRHHIIEAHPAVIQHATASHSKFGQQWEESGPEKGAFKIHAGKWQQEVLKLIQLGELYDAIYFDTFAEDYSQLRLFITEHVPALLHDQGRFSFFNGLGADRPICYDVYSKVVNMHCADAGLDVEWHDIDVDMSNLKQQGKEAWEGVRRRYWTLNKYRLPICTFMG